MVVVYAAESPDLDYLRWGETPADLRVSSPSDRAGARKDPVRRTRAELIPIPFGQRLRIAQSYCTTYVAP